MQAIGDALREARMRQKIDIADVEAATKIRAKYLRALENEEFGLLPGPTFVRTFLRSYAEYLGLDPYLLVEAYRAQYETQDDPEMQTFAPHTRPGGGRARPRAARTGGGGPSPGLLIAVALVAVFAFLLVLGLTGEDDDGGGDQAGNTETTQTEREPAQERERERERTEEREPAPRRVTLRISPAEATYVCIDDGNEEVLFEGVISEPQTWRGRRLRLNMGKATATVRVNGRRVPIEPGPNPVGYDFTPRKREELPIGQRPCA